MNNFPIRALSAQLGKLKMKIVKKAFGGLILAITLLGVEITIEEVSISVTIQVVVVNGD